MVAVSPLMLPDDALDALRGVLEYALVRAASRAPPGPVIS